MARSLLSRCPLILPLLPLLAACGDPGTGEASTSETPTTSPESSADASATTDDTQNTDTSDTTDDSNDDANDTAQTDGCGGPPCGLENEPPAGEEMLITVRNDASVPRFLIPYATYTCNWALASMTDDGEALHWENGSTYPLTCDSLCGWGCSDGPVPALVLAPGAEWTFTWTGDYHKEYELGIECENDFECGTDTSVCELRRQFTGDMITVAVGYSDECPDLIDGCECEDVCEITGYDLELPALAGEFTAELAFPAGGTIVITD